MLRSGFAALVGLALFSIPATATGAPPVAAALAERARTLVGPGQGVYVEAEDGTILVSQAAARAVHPASVSKVPTTLALLRTLGPDHRFTTRFVGEGPVQDGTLAGNLVAQADGDPSFVDENALLVARALRARGALRVAGGLILDGPLIFNWETGRVAPRLERALEGHVSEEAAAALRETNGADASPVAVGFGAARTAGIAPGGTPLVVHRSQPLVPLVKALNGYSNNIFHPLAAQIGGVDAVERIARESVPAEIRDEIVLTNGAGAGASNRLSPRASTALLRALATELAKYGRTLPDVLPVAGVDAGTLRSRLDDGAERGRVVGKTGTYGDYGACALAGAIRTHEHGVVYFAVLNHGVPVPEARERQNAFVSALIEALPGDAWPYQRDEAPAFTRAIVESP